MAKALRTAALVVGAVALVATGVGLALGPTAAAVAGSAGIAGLSIATVATVASFAAGALSLAASLTAKRPNASLSGNQTKFTAQVDAPIPFPIGRTAVAGNIVHRQTFDYGTPKPPNAHQTFFGVWAWGKARGTSAVFEVDGSPVAFGGEAAGGGFNGYMWLRTQAGAQPEAAALQATSFYPYPAGWSAASKMSGYSAFAWTLKFDKDGKKYPGGAVPQPRRIDDWNPVYDPRQDSTFPGGSGPCRAGVESTYVWEGVEPGRPAYQNGALQALTWAIGRFANGKRVLGIGMALAAIDVAAYVEAANVADANAWTVGGVVWSTDGKYDVVKKMLASCSAEPIQLGGLLSCTVDTPRVSLATITDDDIIGRCTVPGSSRSRDRINGIIPKYRSEAHDWQLVDAKKVAVSAYVTEDERPRTKALTWELVQDVDQVAELALYEICNRREIDGIVLPLKLRWIGYKPGDAITVASSTVAMDNQLVVIRRRHLDPSTGAVTLTLRTETTAKHAFALGATTTPPPTPALQTVDRGELLIPGVSASWSAVDDDDGNRPEDGADVTQDHLPDAFEHWTGRQPQDVVDDLGAVTDTISEEVTRGAVWRGESDDILYTADGTPVRVVVEAIGTTVNGHETFVAFLKEVSGDGTARFMFSARADGSIVGIEGFAGGGYDQLSFVASRFLFVDNSGANPVSVLTYEGGVWKLKSIEVDTLKVNTIIKGHVQAGELNAAATFTAADAMLGTGEVTLIETAPFTPGDAVYGAAIAQFTCVHDASTVKDNTALVRAYVDTGSGYELARPAFKQGLRTASGDTFHSGTFGFNLTINATAATKIKITIQATSMPGGDVNTGSYFREPRIDVFTGSR